MRPAIASRCTTALVEPPIAPLAMIAFSKFFLVRIFESLRSSFTISTRGGPTACASA
jgi:hypothetical protein